MESISAPLPYATDSGTCAEPCRAPRRAVNPLGTVLFDRTFDVPARAR